MLDFIFIQPKASRPKLALLHFWPSLRRSRAGAAEGNVLRALRGGRDGLLVRDGLGLLHRLLLHLRPVAFLVAVRASLHDRLPVPRLGTRNPVEFKARSSSTTFGGLVLGRIEADFYN